MPTAVIRRFASSRAIYYTLVCYADRNLSNATAAHDGDTLAHNAPSVAIAPGFEGRTLTSMLAVPAEFLCTVRNDGTTSAAAVDADEDRGEGEDGAYADAAAVSYDDSEDHEPELVSESYVDQEEDGAESPEESASASLTRSRKVMPRRRAGTAGRAWVCRSPSGSSTRWAGKSASTPSKARARGSGSRSRSRRLRSPRKGARRSG